MKNKSRNISKNSHKDQMISVYSKTGRKEKNRRKIENEIIMKEENRMYHEEKCIEEKKNGEKE